MLLMAFLWSTCSSMHILFPDVRLVSVSGTVTAVEENSKPRSRPLIVGI